MRQKLSDSGIFLQQKTQADREKVMGMTTHSSSKKQLP